LLWSHKKLLLSLNIFELIILIAPFYVCDYKFFIVIETNVTLRFYGEPRVIEEVVEIKLIVAVNYTKIPFKLQYIIYENKKKLLNKHKCVHIHCLWIKKKSSCGVLLTWFFYISQFFYFSVIAIQLACSEKCIIERAVTNERI
jgi:hypothetical protein